jgi:prepilin-type processing-associated H-X9-DG protein
MAAKRTACGVNMRSIGQAIELYKGQWKEQFPTARYMPPPFLSVSKYKPLNIVMLTQMDRETSGYRCPGDKIIWSQTYTDTTTTPPTPNQLCGMSYCYVTGLSGETIEQAFTTRYLKISASNTPLIYDFDGYTFTLQNGSTVQTPFFHLVRNVLFADGHVGRYDPTGLSVQ